MTYTAKMMNSKERTYQKAGDISSEKMCYNPDPYIELSHWKCVCSC